MAENAAITPEEIQKLINQISGIGNQHEFEAAIKNLGEFGLPEVATLPDPNLFIEEKLSEITELLATMITIQKEQSKILAAISEGISKAFPGSSETNLSD